MCFVEKGVCISTVSLWILLVYTEASLRLKDLKTSYANLSHLFAAHWYIYWQNLLEFDFLHQLYKLGFYKYPVSKAKTLK